MNNQQQHSLIGSAAMNGTNPRGLPTTQHLYQMQQPSMNQYSHMQQQHQSSLSQQQSHMMNSFSAQKPSDVSTRQYSPSMSNLNGSTYQSMTGQSLHSNLNMESSLGFHQQNESSSHHLQQQFNQSQHQYQSHMTQPPTQQLHQHQQHYSANTHNQPQPPQHQQPPSLHQYNQKHVQQHLSDMMQSHPYNIHQQVSQTHQQPPQHSQMKNVSQHHHQQQSQQLPQPPQQHGQHQQQPYIHVQHRNYQQQSQQKFDKAPQPRRILQNTNNIHQRINQRVIAKDTVPSKEPVTAAESASTEAKPVEIVDENVASTDDDDDVPKDDVKEEVKQDEQEDKNDAESASENIELANTKEKTPMTLIQELAKFNKIDRKYTLLDEQGPAHKKTFFVKLCLGTEEYSSSGASIRKAQQAAAAIALKETKFKHPPVKPAWKTKRPLDIEDGKLTPTVELNGLAMKRGEAATYKAIEPQQPPFYCSPGMDPRAMYSQRYYHYMRTNRDPRYGRCYWPMRYPPYPRMNRPFYVSLRVGHREFIGDGPTRQAARHNAAVKALKVLKNLPEKVDAAVKKAEEEKPKETETPSDDTDDLKSHVSHVHEVAFRRKLGVKFEVLRESGPPHMKTFVTRCTVGDMTTEGEGNSKKMSKKLAAERMNEKLKELPPLPPTTAKPKPKTQVFKKRNKIKAEIQQQKADPNYGVGVNPISRLIQIMCAQKKKEPVYNLIAERGLAARREFVIQIEVDGKTCNGSGPNKKLAKRAAAEAMLELLGYNKPAPQPAKSSIKQPTLEGNGTGNGEKKVTFSENILKAQTDVKNGQQKVPGLLHLPPKTVVTSLVTNSSAKPSLNAKEPLVNLSNILKPNWRPELQLRELCKALNYPLEINDFTKTQANNALEYISRITVGPTDHQQNFLGSSSTLESARDMACMEALKVLVTKAKDMHAAGDGSQLKKSVLSRAGNGARDISH